MNFYFRGPSYLPSSSSSSSSSGTNENDLDEHLINETAKIKAQQTVMGQNYANTNTFLTEYLNQ